MLRGVAGRAVKLSRGRPFPAIRGLQSKVAPDGPNRALILATSAAVTAGLLLYTADAVVHNDAPAGDLAALQEAPGQKTSLNTLSGDETLNTLAWGSNKTHTLSLDDQAPDSIRTPAAAAWLENVALRDIALHERHAVCVDARGDVYQWGDGFGSKPGSSASSGKPSLTLRGKNIMHVQATPTRVFALSASGRVYVLSSSAADQALAPGTPTPASSPWWGTGWLWGEEENVDFAEISPNERLGRGEKFVSIAAGSDHLLALTSSGRTFAHPISMNANSYGQLGIRKFDIPAPVTSALPHHQSRIPVELIPKSIADPYAKSSPAVRRVTPSEGNEADANNAAKLDDRNIHSSDRLFEIPALKGVQVAQIAAGSRSSFARTASGRVLGWGANEYGQIGLGNQVLLDTITIPTEVVLWRFTPAGTKTTCRDVHAAGNLTFFQVERADGSAMPYVDILACGNGQYGGLGNAQFTNAQSTPMRARNVSGLLEFSEKHNNLQPIVPYDISISPTGHVLLTLDTLRHAGPGAVGRDVLAWGANYDYQVGNGKRGSVPAPTVIPDGTGERLMLAKKRAHEVRDLQGRVWKKGVEVEQRAVAGWGNSIVYWRICS